MTTAENARKAGAKTPQDHQKEEATGIRKETIVVWNDREYVITAEALDDVEVLEFVTDNNPVGAARLILGAKQWAAYKDSARNEAGRATASGAGEFIKHIFEELKQGNS